MEVLRQVTFTLKPFKEGTIGDFWYSKEDPEYLIKERLGHFHRWGDKILNDQESGRRFQQTVGIIEESATGRIFEVLPENVVFNSKS